MNRLSVLLVAGLSAGLAACGGNGSDNQAEAANPQGTAPAAEATGETSTDEAQEARDLVADARQTLQAMQSDPDLWSIAQQAEAIYVIPHYGRGGVVVGAAGGDGVVFARENGTWSDPVFYDLGRLSVGAQFGGEGGQIAMLLMTPKSLDSFLGENNFSLNAEVGLTLVDWSAAAQGSAGKGDVVLWSDTEGAFAGATLSATDINFDNEETQAYYNRAVTPEEILGGADTKTDPNRTR